jgi:hypothetical protein
MQKLSLRAATSTAATSTAASSPPFPIWNSAPPRQQQLRKQRLNDATAAELLGDMEDFSTPNAVNALLGNLVRQLARKRIQRRDAMAIAYVGQLLLSSITALDRYEDRQDARNNDGPFFGGPIKFTPAEMPDSPGPISDSTKLPVPFTTAPYAPPKNEEGRA